MVFLVVDVNGRDDVFLRNGAGNAVALLVQPLDRFDVGLDDLLVSSEVQRGNGAESAKPFELGLVSDLVDLNTDFQIAVGLKELFQRIVVIGQDDRTHHAEFLTGNHLE